MDGDSQVVRVRFAPSPTGRLHVGGARTALFNWLFARRHAGTMVLRIEDTDASRSTAESETSLLRDLRWLGLDWDEGPDTGGPHAPYRQSERRPVYAEAAARLVRAGLAYPSLEPEDDSIPHLDPKARGKAKVRPTIPEFDAEALAQEILAGEAPAIRFRLPEKIIQYEDFLRGTMEIDPETLSDFVLLRATGLPTYNFACVVDDADMQITHVLRGEDHLYNTSRQVLLYDALNFQRPQFVHLSLILDENRAKLKKRDGYDGTFVDEYRRQGFLPDALVNYLALLGWSPESGDDILEPQRLVREFDLKRISRAAAIFDVQKLHWMGGEYLRAMPVEELADRLAPFLEEASLHSTPEQRLLWARAFQKYISSLDALPPLVKDILEPQAADADAQQALSGEGVGALLSDLAERLASAEVVAPVDGAQFKKLLQESGKACNMKGKLLFQPVRAALTARGHGPDLPLLFDVMGSTAAVQRLRRVAQEDLGV